MDLGEVHRIGFVDIATHRFLARVAEKAFLRLDEIAEVDEVLDADDIHVLDDQRLLDVHEGHDRTAQSGPFHLGDERKHAIHVLDGTVQAQLTDEAVIIERKAVRQKDRA